MASGLLQDAFSSPPQESATAGPRFRPYASPNHHVTKSRYITSNDSRGYIPVYEYPLNGQWIMMDADDGYILWTGIWKALGNSKADIVKMIESQPDLASVIRRVRGGYLKIQGTWMPYEVALRLSRRVAWPIRHELIPLFGPTFPSTCLSPDQPGFGQVVPSGTGRRRSRRNTQIQRAGLSAGVSGGPQEGWTIISTAGPHNVTGQAMSAFVHQPPPPGPSLVYSQAGSPTRPRTNPQAPHVSSSAPLVSFSTDGGAHRNSFIQKRSPQSRFSPYGSSSPSISLASYGLNKLTPQGPMNMSASFPGAFQLPSTEKIVLPPIQHPSERTRARQASVALPPISSLADISGSSMRDSRTVLRRLQVADEPRHDMRPPTMEQMWERRRSLSVPKHATTSWSPISVRTEAAYREHRHSPTDTSSNFGSSSHHPPRTSVSASVISSPSTTNDGISPIDPSPISPATPRSIDAFADSASPSVFLPPAENGKGLPSASSFSGHWPSDRSIGGNSSGKDCSLKPSHPEQTLAVFRSREAELRRQYISAAESSRMSSTDASRPIRPW